MNKIDTIADVTSIREIRDLVNKWYAECEIDNKELLTNWLISRNWKPFDSLGFDDPCTQLHYMNIKAKIEHNVTITYAKPTAKDTRITGTTKKGFMPDGKIYNTKGKTVEEVIEKVTREYIKRQKQIKKKPTTIDDLLEASLKFKKNRRGVKDATIEIDRQNYEKFVRGSKLEAMPIEKILHKHIEDFVCEEMIPKYQESRKDKSKPTTNDVTKRLTVLRNIFSYAVREGYISVNPFNADRLDLRGVTAKPKVKNFEDSGFTEEETKIIINHLMNTYKNGRNHNTANIADIIMCLTGIRAGEAAALKWSDCFLKDEVPYIHIERQEDNAHNITDVKCDSDAGRRVVPLPPQAVEVLKMLRKDYKVISEWVFAHADGTRVTKHQMAAALSNAIEHEPSIKKTKGKGTHAFRKTFCSRLLANKIPIATAQKVMGHKEASTTLRYYTYDVSSLQDTSDAVSKTFDTLKLSV